MAEERSEQSAFRSLLNRLARVPKAEIEAEERREEANKARRKNPKPPAKPGQIVPTTR